MTKKYRCFLLLAVWDCACALLVFTRSTPLATGDMRDTDDYLRLVRVFALLDGQVTDNYVVDRMGPAGGGVAWSPLIDWLLAAFIKTGSLFTDRYEATLWTATLYPLGLLLVFMMSAFWYVREAGDDKLALRAPFTLLFLFAALVQFAPGRVDHHNVQAIILALACGFLIKLYRFPLDRGPALACGFLMALAWSVGAEAVPWVAGITAAIGIFWLFHGRDYLYVGRTFSLFLMISTTILLPLTRGFDGFFAVECDGISLSFLSFAAAAFLFWHGVALFPSVDVSPARRFWAGALLGGLLAGGLYAVLPGCLRDPYSVTDPELRRMWLEHVNEARPALSFWKDERGLVIFSLGTLVLGLMAAVWGMKKEPERRPLWAGFAVMLLAAVLFALWQMRTAYLGQVIAIFPLSWLFVVIGRAYWRLPRPTRLTLSGSFFVIALCAFLIAWPQRHDRGKPRMESGTPQEECDLKAASRALNELEGSQIIASYVIDGGELLFRTPHRVLAGSYHRNAEGILAAHRILGAPSAVEARGLANRYDVSIILVCEENAPYWNSLSPSGQSFAAQLMGGELPPWVEIIERSPQDRFAIFRVIQR